jgi:uncharacterized protein (TIGR02996 family)
MTEVETRLMLEGLHAALDADPGDRAARSALADLLEEQGNDIGAAFHRWLLETGRHPYKGHEDTPYGQTRDYWWFSNLNPYPPGDKAEEYNPALLGPLLQDCYKHSPDHVHNWFKKRQEAEQFLFKALVKEGLL